MTSSVSTPPAGHSNNGLSPRARGRRHEPAGRRRRFAVFTATVALASAVLGAPGPAHAGGSAAPGYPGADADWRPANKSFLTTAYGLKTSNIWATGQDGTLSEVFYPDLSTPALRDLDFAVLDGKGGAWKVSTAAIHATSLVYADAPIFTTVSTATNHAWRVTTTFVTDPLRTSVIADVQLTSLNKRPYSLIAIADPSLNNEGSDDIAFVSKGAATAYEFDAAVTMKSSTPFAKTSVGFMGTSDGWTDVVRDGKMNWSYASTDELAGNVVLSGLLPLDGLKKQRTTIALGFGETTKESIANTNATLKSGTVVIAAAVHSTWTKYLNSLPKPPSSLTSPLQRRVYRMSQMALAASEDKQNPGAFIASPSTPWAWGSTAGGGYIGYHMVWGRDTYHIGTALLAMGDTAAATRIVRYLFDIQAKSDGGMPQYSHVDGTPMASGIQLDELGLPIVLAWQLGLKGDDLWSEVKAAADYMVTWKRDSLTAPATGQERWEERSGYSPSTIAAEIAGLVCAREFALQHGDAVSASLYDATAKQWATSLKSWVVTSTGSLSAKPYFIRLSQNGNPNAGTKLNTGNGGPTVDERTIVDAGFLELVRLGILPAIDADVVNSLAVVDANISVTIGDNQYFYRYNHDGYGEAANGSPWSGSTGGKGRLWPLLSGERGEYELAAGRSAKPQIAAMTAAAAPTGLISEQIWDVQAPAKLPPQASADGKATKTPKFVAGTGTMSATPLAWSQAQFIRLAWSAARGKPVETPLVVQCTFVKIC